jgi:AcrR family transcriptional regulator
MKEPSTKEKILSAARELFIKDGFTGTSVGKIAALADVNHSLIFHHFENKAQLWVAVKQAIVEEYQTQQETLPSSNLPFQVFLEKLFANNMKFYRDNPDIVRMFNWQRVESRDETTPAIGITMSRQCKLLLDALAHYQKQGDIASNLTLEFILTFLMSLIGSAALDPNVFIATEREKQAYVKFCVECALRAFHIAE